METSVINEHEEKIEISDDQPMALTEQLVTYEAEENNQEEEK